MGTLSQWRGIILIILSAENYNFFESAISQPSFHNNHTHNNTIITISHQNGCLDLIYLNCNPVNQSSNGGIYGGFFFSIFHNYSLFLT